MDSTKINPKSKFTIIYILDLFQTATLTADFGLIRRWTRKRETCILRDSVECSRPNKGLDGDCMHKDLHWEPRKAVPSATVCSRARQGSYESSTNS